MHVTKRHEVRYKEDDEWTKYSQCLNDIEDCKKYIKYIMDSKRNISNIGIYEVITIENEVKI